jgi:phage baseplate assembly protein W
MGLRLTKENDQYKQTGAQSEIYSDFLHTFLPHPNTGQISRKTNEDAIKLALRNLIMTNKYERLRNPEYGGHIHKYLFEPFNEVTNSVIRRNVKETIEKYEPRVYVEDVIVRGEEETNQLFISIFYIIIMSEEKQQLDLTLYRAR